MKRFIIKCIIFVALLLVTDVAIGLTFDYIGNHPKGGETARLNHICKDSNEDILIVGSSRALHHYSAKIIEDSLHFTTYNCGVEGNGIVLFYMQLCDILDHYTPKTIVYDICPGYDIYLGEDNSRFLGSERRFYGKSEIDSVFWAVDKYERYKMLFNTYRYNSNFLILLSDYFRPSTENQKGFRPLYGELKDAATSVNKSKVVKDYDQFKLHLLEKYIQKCKLLHINLIFVASPTYMKCVDDEAFAVLTRLSSRYNVSFINNYQNKMFVGNKSLFYDKVHMNNVGAEKYSKFVCHQLDSLIR